MRVLTNRIMPIYTYIKYNNTKRPKAHGCITKILNNYCKTCTIIIILYTSSQCVL